MQQFSQPQHRSNDLSLQQLALEMLIYDERTHKAFCLNPVASAVWNLMDGQRTPCELAGAATRLLAQPVSEDAVLVALGQFQADGLLEPSSIAVPTALLANARISRRRLMGGITAGAAVMLPLVAAISAPRAAQAYNGNVSGAAEPIVGGSKSSEPAGSAASAGSNSTPLFNDDIKR